MYTNSQDVSRQISQLFVSSDLYADTSLLSYQIVRLVNLPFSASPNLFLLRLETVFGRRLSWVLGQNFHQGMDWVEEIGPTDNSATDNERPTDSATDDRLTGGDHRAGSVGKIQK